MTAPEEFWHVIVFRCIIRNERYNYVYTSLIVNIKAEEDQQLFKTPEKKKIR
jgi:hypothetical protein